MTKIIHVWSVLCQSSSVDADTNNISLFNLVEQLGLPEDAPFPIALGDAMQIVTMWARIDINTPVSGEERISVVSPTNEILQTFPPSVIDLKKFIRLRHRFVAGGLVFPEWGRYLFNIELREGDSEEFKLVTSIPLDLVNQKMIEAAISD
jgi:hypothetical protein